jgi:hypothetical protein
MIYIKYNGRQQLNFVTSWVLFSKAIILVPEKQQLNQ